MNAYHGRYAMTTIFNPDQTVAIFTAISDIEMGNNGYADIGTDKVIADAVATAGYTVLLVVSTTGQWVYRGFTAAAQAALAKESFGIPINLK